MSTALKSLAISLMRSSSSLSSGSESSLLLAKLTFGLLMVSTSRSIRSSKSEPPCKDSSFFCRWVNLTCLSNYFFICVEICCYTFPFTLSPVSGFLLTVLTTTNTIILYTGIGTGCVSGVNAIVAVPVAFAFFGLMLIVATPLLILFLLYAVRLLLKVSNFFPISSLIKLCF